MLRWSPSSSRRPTWSARRSTADRDLQEVIDDAVDLGAEVLRIPAPGRRDGPRAGSQGPGRHAPRPCPRGSARPAPLHGATAGRPAPRADAGPGGPPRRRATATRSVPTSSRPAVGQPTRRRSAHRAQPVGEERHAVRREDRLGVELDALDGVLAMAHAHDQAVRRRGGHLEDGGQRVARHRQRVVAAGLERRGQPREAADAAVVHGRLLAVHRLDRDDLAAVDEADGLVAEADAEDGRRRPESRDDLERDAGVLRPRRTRADDDAVGARARDARPRSISSLRTTSTSAPSWQRYW